MRGVALVLAIAGCGRISFDPLSGDGGGGDGIDGTRKVQHGISTFGAGTDATEDIELVDSTRSFLVFTTRATSTDPASGQVTGRIEDGNRLHFERAANGGDVIISWYVVSHEELAVAAGTSMGDGAPAIPAVDVGATFPIVTHATGGADYNEDDYVRVRLGTGGLALEIGAGGTLPELMDWQLVSWGGATVVPVDIPIQPGNVGAGLVVPGVDTQHSFTQASWSTPLDMVGIGCNAIRGDFEGELVSVARENSPCWRIDTTTHLVTWPRANIQRGTTRLEQGEQLQSIAITSVVPERAFALLSSRGGSTTFVGAGTADDIGVTWVTADLVDARHLELARGSATEEVTVTWYVIELP